MKEFPYTYEEIKTCQIELKELLEGLEKIEDLIGMTKTAIHRYRADWKEKIKDLEPLIKSVDSISKNYVPLIVDSEADEVGKVMVLNQRDNFKLTELETSIDVLNQLPKTDNRFDRMLDEISLVKLKLRPLQSWRLYRFLKRLYER